MNADVFVAVRTGELSPLQGATVLVARRASWIDRLLCRVLHHPWERLPIRGVSCWLCVRCGSLRFDGLTPSCTRGLTR